MEKNTLLLRDTEAFMRGELDNVTVAGGSIVLDLVQGSYVPYGCYTSAAIPMPLFDALWLSWNVTSPQGTAVEAQARVLVDGNWTAWVGFGKWSPSLRREGSHTRERGPLRMGCDQLRLDSKRATQAQLRIYLYTKQEKATPAVHLLGVSVRTVGNIPARGRPVNRALHLMPYVVSRRCQALRKWLLHRLMVARSSQAFWCSGLANTGWRCTRLKNTSWAMSSASAMFFTRPKAVRTTISP